MISFALCNYVRSDQGPNCLAREATENVDQGIGNKVVDDICCVGDSDPSTLCNVENLLFRAVSVSSCFQRQIVLLNFRVEVVVNHSKCWTTLVIECRQWRRVLPAKKISPALFSSCCLGLWTD